MAISKRTISIWPIALIGIFLFSIVLYLPSIMGGAIWDDIELISGHAFGKNTFQAAFTNPFLGRYFRPLTSASFVFDSSFAKSTPFFYHQTNILLHAITAVLVACLAITITQKKSAGILAGLFFVTQPMQVGAAAWIGGRTDVLSALFLTAFLICLIRYLQNSKSGWLIGSAVTFLLAALAKEQAIAILPAIPLAVFVFGSRKWKDALKVCIPFGIAVVVFIGLWIIDAPAPFGVKSSLVDMIMLPLRTLAHYGLAFLAPNDPSLQTYTLENYPGLPWVAVGIALLAGFVWFVKFCWKDHRPLAWLAVCALLVYIPISNFPPVPSFVVGPYRCAESGTAVACLFGIIAAYAISSKRIVLALAMLANLVVGTVVTWWGIHQWTTPEILFKTQAEIDPHFLAGVRNYAQALEMQGNPAEEVRLTNNTLSWMFGTDKWVDLLAEKKMDVFTPELIHRLKSNGGYPDRKALAAFISANAGGLAKLKRMPEAIKVEQEALMIGPDDPRIHFAYGQLLLKTNRPEAIHQWEIALKITPHFSACAAALAHERIIDGRYKEAVALLEPITAELGWAGSVWIDLAKAKIALNDPVGAGAALDGAERAIFVKQTEIDPLRKQIKDLMHAKTGAGP